MSTIPPRPDLGLPPARPAGRRRRRRVVVLAIALVVAVVAVSGIVFAVVPQVRVCVATRRLLDEAATQPVAGGDAPVPVTKLDADLPVTTTVHAEALGETLWTSPQDVAQGRDGEGAWVSHLTDTRFDAGILRQWRADDGGILQAEVMQFPNHTDALAFQHWILSETCLNSSVAFAVAGVPGSIGLRFRQSSGNITEQVSFVRGSRRYLAVRCAGSPSRSQVLAMTHDLAATAA